MVAHSCSPSVASVAVSGNRIGMGPLVARGIASAPLTVSLTVCTSCVSRSPPRPRRGGTRSILGIVGDLDSVCP